MGGHRQEVRGLKWSSDYQSGLWQQTFLCGIVVGTCWVILESRSKSLPSLLEARYFVSRHHLRPHTSSLLKSNNYITHIHEFVKITEETILCDGRLQSRKLEQYKSFNQCFSFFQNDDLLGIDKKYVVSNGRPTTSTWPLAATTTNFLSGIPAWPNPFILLPNI